MKNFAKIVVGFVIGGLALSFQNCGADIDYTQYTGTDGSSSSSSTSSGNTTTPAPTPTPAPNVAKPVINTPPSDVSASTFDNGFNFIVIPYNQATPKRATFTVSASGQGLSYQWYRVSSNGTMTIIAGATSPTYAFDVNTGSQAGIYRVNVLNSGGTVSADAKLLIDYVNINF